MKKEKSAAAKWIRRTHLLRRDEYVCSACGKAQDRPLRQCPACGARMGGIRTGATWVDEAEGLSALLDDDW